MNVAVVFPRESNRGEGIVQRVPTSAGSNGEVEIVRDVRAGGVDRRAGAACQDRVESAVAKRRADDSGHVTNGRSPGETHLSAWRGSYSGFFFPPAARRRAAARAHVASGRSPGETPLPAWRGSYGGLPPARGRRRRSATRS